MKSGTLVYIIIRPWRRRGVVVAGVIVQAPHRNWFSVTHDGLYYARSEGDLWLTEAEAERGLAVLTLGDP